MVGIYNENSGFECCFCRQSIIETKIDPVDINVVYNEDILNKTGCSFNFYAHYKCLKEKLHENMQGYLVTDDDMTEV